MIQKLISLCMLLSVVLCDKNNTHSELEVVQRELNMCKDKCISKCCPTGMVYHRTPVVEDGVATGRNFSGCEPIDQNDADFESLYRINVPNIAVVVGELLVHLKEFQLLIGITCKEFSRKEDEHGMHFEKDGQLYLEVATNIPPWITQGPDEYCIDTFVSEDEEGKRISRLDAFICLREQTDISQYFICSICMLISCVFILATLAVYAWLPELRNMHGMVLMVCLSCFFFGFVFLATLQILSIIDNVPTPGMCLVLTILIYFSLVSAFFWLNVMSFDIWCTFRYTKRGHSARLKSTKARFLAYCGYAFGMSTALTILLVGLEFSSLPRSGWMPLLRHSNRCFIHGSSKLIYLYGPILILCIANLVLFILTAVKIVQIRKQISVLKAKDNSTHDPHRNAKQRLVLYVKLFLVMGINWVLEVISSLYPELPLWKYTDAYNVLTGLTIFIIFVCKRKIFRLIKKRYKQLRGEPMSRTQTTTTSRTTSTRLQMISFKK